MFRALKTELFRARHRLGWQNHGHLIFVFRPLIIRLAADRILDM